MLSPLRLFSLLCLCNHLQSQKSPNLNNAALGKIVVLFPGGYGNPQNLVDGNTIAEGWEGAPNWNEIQNCSVQVHATIDLSDTYNISEVWLWEYPGETRRYCGRRVEVSTTGAFAGEQAVVFADPKSFGEEHTLDGELVGENIGVFQYVRVYSSRNTIDTWVRMLEVAVYGDLQNLDTQNVALGKRATLSANAQGYAQNIVDGNAANNAFGLDPFWENTACTSSSNTNNNDNNNYNNSTTDNTTTETHSNTTSRNHNNHDHKIISITTTSTPKISSDDIVVPYCTIDLEDAVNITEVRIWDHPDPENSRRLCSGGFQRMELSMTGAFAGEQMVVTTIDDRKESGDKGVVMGQNVGLFRFVRVFATSANEMGVVRLREVAVYGTITSHTGSLHTHSGSRSHTYTIPIATTTRFPSMIQAFSSFASILTVGVLSLLLVITSTLVVKQTRKKRNGVRFSMNVRLNPVWVLQSRPLASMDQSFELASNASANEP